MMGNRIFFITGSPMPENITETESNKLRACLKMTEIFF